MGRETKRKRCACTYRVGENKAKLGVLALREGYEGIFVRDYLERDVVEGVLQ